MIAGGSGWGCRLEVGLPRLCHRRSTQMPPPPSHSRRCSRSPPPAPKQPSLHVYCHVSAQTALEIAGAVARIPWPPAPPRLRAFIFQVGRWACSARSAFPACTAGQPAGATAAQLSPCPAPQLCFSASPLTQPAPRTSCLHSQPLASCTHRFTLPAEGHASGAGRPVLRRAPPAAGGHADLLLLFVLLLLLLPVPPCLMPKLQFCCCEAHGMSNVCAGCAPCKLSLALLPLCLPPTCRVPRPLPCPADYPHAGGRPRVRAPQVAPA